MTVDTELGVGPQDLHRGQANRIQTGHDAGAALGYHMVMAREHLIEVAGNVGGIHGHLAGAFGMLAHHADIEADRGAYDIETLSDAVRAARARAFIAS